LRTNGVTDEALDKIVREVLAAIQSRGLGEAMAAPGAKVEAQAAPSMRARPGEPTAQAQPSARTAAARPANAQRKVFLTAEMLLQRLAGEAGQGRTIDLAHNEFLTPAAMDLADERHMAVRKQPRQLAPPDGAACSDAVRRSEPENAVTGTLQMPAAVCSDAVRRSGPEYALTGTLQTSAIGLVTYKPNELVRRVLDSLARERITAFDFNRTGCWIVNTRTLCEAVVSGGVSGGVVMVPLAADAVVLANKVRGIRAVQGLRPEGLALAMDRLAPNVLVLEHSSATFHEVRTMLRMFVGGQGAKGTAKILLGAVEELERA
jgi:ribose 5-phosphate isomerase RpiB